MKREMEAYIVLLHLVSQGWANFADIRDLLGWDIFKMGVALSIIAYINEKLIALSEEWGEDVPHINAFMFRTDSGECSTSVRTFLIVMTGSSHPRAKLRNMLKKLRLTPTGIKS